MIKFSGFKLKLSNKILSINNFIFVKLVESKQNLGCEKASSSFIKN